MDTTRPHSRAGTAGVATPPAVTTRTTRYATSAGLMTLTASVDARPLGSDGLPAADGREPSERARSNHKVFVATLAVLALLSLLLGGMDRALIAVALLLGALGAVMIIVAVLLRPFAVFSALLGRRG